MHGAPLFDDAIILTRFQFEKYRRQRIVVVIAQAKFETIFGSVSRGLVSFQIVRIEIESMNGIRKIRPAQPVFVEFEVAADEIANARRNRLIDKILQFETLRW